jgi:hypothetical protein
VKFTVPKMYLILKLSSGSPPSPISLCDLSWYWLCWLGPLISRSQGLVNYLALHSLDWARLFQKHMQSVPITTKVMILNHPHGEVYSIQYYVIKFCLWIFIQFLYKPLYEILNSTKNCVEQWPSLGKLFCSGLTFFVWTLQEMMALVNLFFFIYTIFYTELSGSV